MNLIATSLGAYLALTGGVFFMQRTLLYPGTRDLPDITQARAAGIEEVTTETADGLQLTHWYRPPADDRHPVLVVFHGNAGHVGDRVPKLSALLRAGYGMLLAGYRGYGGNPGRPSEESLTGDARVLLDWLAGQQIGPERTVLYGESLGTGIAVKMAAERSAAAVVLEAPYTSITELAQMHYWYLPARWLLLDKWDSIAHVERIEAPLLVLHGEQDRTVPSRFGRRLFEAAPEPKELLLLDDANHVDLYDYPSVPERVIDFLRRHVGAASVRDAG